MGTLHGGLAAALLMVTPQLGAVISAGFMNPAPLECPIFLRFEAIDLAINVVVTVGQIAETDL